MKKYILIVFLLVFGVSSMAQDEIKLIVLPDAQIDSQINDADKDRIVKTVEELLSEYMIAASLKDPKEGRVNQASVQRFQKMFRPGALMVHDYHEVVDQELVSAEDYALGAFNNLKLPGVEFLIEKAELKSMSLDGVGYYTPYVEVTKVLYNYINQNGIEEKAVTGIRIEQKFYFDIYKDDLTEATISKIDHMGEFLPVAEKTSLLSFSIGAGTSSYNATTSNYWDKEHRSATLEPKGGLNYSVGVEYLSDGFINKTGSTKRILAWSVGLRYATYQMKTDLMSFSIDDFEQVGDDPEDVDTQVYIRHVGPVEAVEDIRFNTVEIPIGLNLNLLKNQRSTVYLAAKYNTSIILSSKGTLSGEGVYDGTFINQDPTTIYIGVGDPAANTMLETHGDGQGELDDGYAPYRIGVKDIEQDADPDLASSISSLVISPTAYINFTDNSDGWGFLIALDAGFQFGSFITHDPIDDLADEALKYEDDFQGSLLNYYADDLSALNLGFRVGIFHRLSN